jgi:hypothetical protein
MRTFTLCCCMALLAGCAKTDKPAQAAADEGAMATPAPISLADVAGTWTISSMGAASDSVILTYQLTATADPAGWTFSFPGRDPIALRNVMAAGDSIVAEAGPFESGVRKGVQVSTRTVMRLQDGALMGMTVAHYAAAGADSVMTFRRPGSRGASGGSAVGPGTAVTRGAPGGAGLE